MPAGEYYPQHFAKSRAYFKDAFQEIQSVAGESVFNRYQTERRTFPRFIVPLLQKQYNGDAASTTIATSVELAAATACAEFRFSGARVIDVDRYLVAAIKHSDLSEVSLNDLKFPFENFFIHVGEESGIQFNDGVTFTGAYVRSVEGITVPGVRITLCGLRAQVSGSIEPWNGETYDLIFKGGVLDIPIPEAIDAAIAVDKADLQQSYQRLTPGIAKPLEERHDRNRTALVAACNIIANTLCYLTAYPDDIREAWQLGAPQRLVDQASSAKPTEARRAISKLGDLGFLPIRRVGENFSDLAHDENREGPSPHWRRGHWRHQVCGPQLSSRKIIWVRPTRVLGADIREAPRVYRVTP